MTSTSPTIADMEVHTLSPSHADLLAQAPDHMVPNLSLVTGVVAEQDGKFLGRRFLCLVPHVEAALDAADAPPETATALELALTDHIASLGLSGVMRAAPIDQDLSRFGYEPLPCLLWVKRGK